MDPVNTHAAFDKDEQEILGKLVPEGATVNEPLAGLPAADSSAADATAAAPAVAAAPAPATPAAEAAAAPAAAPASAPAADTTSAPAAAPAPQGDTRAALRAARHAEKRLRDENLRLNQELEDLKAGNGPVSTAISDEELAQLEEDFPLQAKIVRRQRELEQKLAQQPAAAPASTEFEPLSYDPAVQEVIDSVPQLVAWQYDPAAQDKFDRAISYDKALVLDPDWKDKTAAERFAEAARRTEAALAPAPQPPSGAPAPAAAPAAARTDPATVIANAPVEGPKGISDFRGGAPASLTPAPNYAGMSDEAIMASLPAG